MTLHIYDDLEQGSDQWLAARRGMVTASVVGRLVTSRQPGASAYPCPECNAIPYSPCTSKTSKTATPIKTLHASRIQAAATGDLPRVIAPADGEDVRNLTLLLAAERITDWTDPTYVTNDMLRGRDDEPRAIEAYAEHLRVDVAVVGFMVEDRWGFPIGYSPDGLVGSDGLIEIKSRRQKKQLATVLSDEVPPENMAQIQCGLLVSGRKWCDYVSYSGGMALWAKRVEPDQRWFDAIVAAVEQFETAATQMVATYQEAVRGLPMTERTVDDLGLVF